MQGYAELEVFTEREKHLLAAAQRLVTKTPYALDGEPVRCHELARAVGRLLELETMDGHFGYVEHSWLWTSPLKIGSPWELPNVLDVYVPGAMPQVQLVHMHTRLPHRYSSRPIKDLEIRIEMVERLIDLMKESH